MLFCGIKVFSCWYFVGLNFFLLVFRGFEIFSCGYLRVQKIFSRVFCGSKVFVMGTCGLESFSHMDRKFLLLVFLESKTFSCAYVMSSVFFFMVHFVVESFSIVDCMNKNGKSRNTETHLKPRFIKIDLCNCQLFILKKCFKIT